MKHVLIIEKDGDISLRIEERLAALGPCSFERVWSEEQAVAAAGRRPPDLLVVGAADQGCPLNAAQRICGAHAVPTLLARPTGSDRRPLPQGARLTGPFPFRAMAWAVREAENLPACRPSTT